MVAISKGRHLLSSLVRLLAWNTYDCYISLEMPFLSVLMNHPPACSNSERQRPYLPTIRTLIMNGSIDTPCFFPEDLDILLPKLFLRRMFKKHNHLYTPTHFEVAALEKAEHYRLL